jgi:methyl-accepting chemotaxis protein
MNPALHPLPRIPQKTLDTSHHNDILCCVAAGSDLESSILQNLSSDVESLSNHLEDEISRMVGNFMEISKINTAQGNFLEQVVKQANSIQVEDKDMNLDEFTDFVTRTFSEIIDLNIFYSKEAMNLVFVLGNVMVQMERVEAMVNKIGVLNSRTNMVAINATIEAVRSGAEGSTFKVVSDELRELAEGINGFAHNLGAEINTIRQGMTESHKIMRLANKDMIPQMILQEKTERITKNLVKQSQYFSETVSNVMENTIKCKEISKLVSNFQVQDRAKQALEYVTDTMRAFAKRNTLQSHSLEALMGTKTDKQGSEQEAFQALNQGIAALSLEESREKRLRAFLTRGQDGSLKDLVGLNKKENQTFSGEDIELF